jgi:anthranilate synthase
MPARVTVGRYHSLHARRAVVPASLLVTAETDDGVVMAVEHRSRPVAAVQFHPESVMTAPGFGAGLIGRALAVLTAREDAALPAVA